MGRFAIIENGVVQNLVLAGSAVECRPADWQFVVPVDDMVCAVGDRYADGMFAPAAPPAAPPYRLSQKLLMDRLVKLGKWQAFKAALAQPEFELARDAFYLADYLASDDPLFTDFAPRLAAAIGLTPEELAQVTAPPED